MSVAEAAAEQERLFREAAEQQRQQAQRSGPGGPYAAPHAPGRRQPPQPKPPSAAAMPDLRSCPIEAAAAHIIKWQHHPCADAARSPPRPPRVLTAPLPRRYACLGLQSGASDEDLRKQCAEIAAYIVSRRGFNMTAGACLDALRKQCAETKPHHTRPCAPQPRHMVPPHPCRYKHLALRLHPDKTDASGAEEAFGLMKAAYTRLTQADQSWLQQKRGAQSAARR